MSFQTRENLLGEVLRSNACSALSARDLPAHAAKERDRDAIDSTTPDAGARIITQKTRTILATGASGNVGRAVVAALCESGHRVRAGARRPELLVAPETVTCIAFDYEDAAAFAPALDGVDGVFLVAPPLDSQAPEKMGPFIDELRSRSGVQVVLNSAMGANLDERAPLCVVENAIKTSGLPVTILRPNFFMENFTGSYAGMIAGQDGIFLAAGEGKTSFISVIDIAAAARAAFEKGLAGAEFDLTGGQALDHFEVAEVIGAEIGRIVTETPKKLSGRSLGRLFTMSPFGANTKARCWLFRYDQSAQTGRRGFLHEPLLSDWPNEPLYHRTTFARFDLRRSRVRWRRAELRSRMSHGHLGLHGLGHRDSRRAVGRGADDGRLWILRADEDLVGIERSGRLLLRRLAGDGAG